ncbi:MAG: sodium:solute symporter [Bacteroidota bacterium]
MDFNLGTIDISIMVLYAVFIIGYGLYHAKRESSEDYFLGGRSMTWPIVGISLFAANISSSTLVGLAGAAFVANTHVYNYEWLAAVVLVFFAIFFLPFYLKSKVYTMPEFLERRYDARSRYYFSFITIIGNVIIDTASGLYVGSIVLKLIFPDLSMVTIITVLAFAAAAYTIPGGLNSVIQTEVIQAILLVIGSCFLTYYALDSIGGWEGMVASLNEMAAAGQITSEIQGGGTRNLKDAGEVLSLVRPANDAFMPWTGLLLGAPILGFYFWANNQFMVQRVLGAKSINHGRWGALFAGLLKLPVILIMVIPGTAAIVMYQGQVIENSDDIYPRLLFDLLPTGMLGVVLAGLMAAMMSSVSATFNSASTLITMDFVQKLNPNMSSQQLVRSGQIATLVLVILASIWAPFIQRFGGLFEYLQFVLSFICPPIVAAFVLGLFWKRANANGAFYSLATGFILTVLLLVFKFGYGSEATGFVKTINDVHFLHMCFYLFILCTVVHVVVSLSTDPPLAEKLEGYIWKKEIFVEETKELETMPWYLNYRYQSVVLLILTAVVVGYFW